MKIKVNIAIDIIIDGTNAEELKRIIWILQGALKSKRQELINTTNHQERISSLILSRKKRRIK